MIAFIDDHRGVGGVEPVRTTVQDKAVPFPLDHVNRVFHAPAPNVLWVSDFTYVSTWTGFAYGAFVIDAYARRIVGWCIIGPRIAVRQHPLHRALGGGRH